LEEQMEDVERVSLGLQEYASPKIAIEYWLERLFSEEKYVDFNRAIGQLIEKMSEIRAFEQGDDSFNPMELRHFITFFTWATNEYVVRSASSMTALLRTMKNPNENDSYIKYRAPNSYTLNRHILAAQMRSMERGDSFMSLANPRLYEDADWTDDAYLDATKKALQRDVSIRRIFNLCECDANGVPHDARQVVLAQIEQFKNLPFACRFLDNSVLVDLTLENALKAVDTDGTSATLSCLYFGLFVHNRKDGGKDCLLYKTIPKTPHALVLNASTIKLRGMLTSNGKLFEMLWERCANVKNPYQP